MNLETERIILRTLTMDDAGEVFKNLSSDPNVTKFLPYTTLETKEATEDMVSTWLFALKDAKSDDRNKILAITLKTTGELIGVIDLIETDAEAKSFETSYQIGKPWWGHGYAAEALEKVIDYAFETLGINRIWGVYDPRNANSGKVMEKAGMTYEGLHRQYKARGGKLVDRVYYGIIREDRSRQALVDKYTSLECNFDDFVPIPFLSEGNLQLICLEKRKARPEEDRVPSYHFAICKAGEKVGNLDIRIGYSERLYYGGHIGYSIDKEHRGKGYTEIACRLVTRIAKAHGMKTLLITCDMSNIPSQRVCEKLGTVLIDKSPIPPTHDLHVEGAVKLQHIYAWDISKI